MAVVVVLAPELVIVSVSVPVATIPPVAKVPVALAPIATVIASFRAEPPWVTDKPVTPIAAVVEVGLIVTVNVPPPVTAGNRIASPTTNASVALRSERSNALKPVTTPVAVKSIPATTAALGRKVSVPVYAGDVATMFAVLNSALGPKTVTLPVPLRVAVVAFQTPIEPPVTASALIVVVALAFTGLDPVLQYRRYV